jgi:D-glycero-D-manno-heptose 1,7-bisphosphate phosphatase
VKKDLDLVILCGGRGKRLGKITKSVNKCLIKVNNKQFIEYLINFYKKYNFKKIYLLTGYKNYLFNKYHKKKFNFIEINCLPEKKPMGTAGCLYKLRNKIKNNFILINGDSYLDYNLEEFIKIDKKFISKIILINNKNYKKNKKLSQLNVINKDEVCYNYKNKNQSYMNGGVYLFKTSIFKYIKNCNSSLEDEIMPILINKKKVQGQKVNNFFIDIGIKKNLNRAKKIFKSKFKLPAVFFDRDGVLNYNYGYVFKYENFKWKKGILDLLFKLSNKKIYIFIVTNQSGIGRGYYKLRDFEKLHIKIKTFLSQKSIYFNDVKFCPHHPNVFCICRKPKTKMIMDIIFENDVNVKKSIFIGDRLTDYIAAKNSKINFMYNTKGYQKRILNFID